MTIHLYCLRGPYPEYYVGKCKSLGRRMAEHRSGNGSKHTKAWKSFEVIETRKVIVKTESEAHFAEAAYAREMRDRLPGMMVFGPGEHKKPGYYRQNRKKPGTTFF